MVQFNYILPTVKQIEKLAQKLILTLTVLNAQLDTQVTASTDADADYAAEVADAHVDGDEGLVDILQYHAVEELA